MTKGCLNKLIFIAIVAFTGLTLLVAGIYISYIFLMDGIKTQTASTSEELKTRSELVADFSEIPSGYSVTNAYDIAGVKVVLANYSYNDQVVGLVDPGWVLDSSKEEVNIKQLEEKVKVLISNINKQDKLKINNFTVEKVDYFKAQNQTIPYLKVLFSLSGAQQGQYRGIIGLIKNPKTKKTEIVISYNEPAKFRHLTAEKFFRKIKF